MQCMIVDHSMHTMPAIILVVRVASWMKDDDFVIPVAFMGAPTIGIERLENGTEPISALKCLQNMYTVGQFQTSGTLANAGKSIYYALIKLNETKQFVLKMFSVTR